MLYWPITARIVAFIGDENACLRSRLPLTERSSAMQMRRRFKQTKSFQDRLADFIAGECSESAPSGTDQYELRKKIRQAATASNIERWAASPELQPPM
jgi:hypothetical protein